MSKRLNDLLIGKIRHNLKTHLNIVCGFSELLIEELEDDADFADDELAIAALNGINQSGESIVQYIDQMFAAHNFSLEDVFSQLDVQAQAFKTCTDEFIARINNQVAWFQELGPSKFFVNFEEDFRKISMSTQALQGNVESLQSGSITSIETLVEHRVLSEDDVALVGKFSESLEDTPDVLETKYPSTILVVDDNPGNTEYLRRKLIAAQHTVCIANSGVEAESVLTGETQVDLILLDILMPDLSGYEILGRNKELLQSKNIPVVVLSSLDEQETVYRCLESGAQDFIAKPVNFMILAARINAALERKYLLDREEQHLARIESEKQKNEELLLNILPRSIANRMKANEYLIADSIPACSIIFADIVGFTPLSEALGPVRVVEMLNGIFTQFDIFCESIGVEKIKTIGDCYMAAGGVLQHDPEHASKTVELGMRMLSCINELGDVEGHHIRMRIGVHSGPAVAGVIGRKKFIYDLWGDTVNTAGRMESHGEPGAIHLSSETAVLLAKNCPVEPRGDIFIKGKGTMNTFFLRL